MSITDELDDDMSEEEESGSMVLCSSSLSTNIPNSATDVACSLCNEVGHPHSSWITDRQVQMFLNHLRISTGYVGSTKEIDALKSLLSKAHGGRRGHWGVSKTCKYLHELYPGHKIPMKLIMDFIATCPVCQKERLTALDGISPIIRHIKPMHKRSRIGIDDLAITPIDKNSESLYYTCVRIPNTTSSK